MFRILLVDDDTHFRKSLKISLETQGHFVFENSNGMDALEFLKDNQSGENPVDRVIADARMPGLDGFWLTDQIVATYPSLRVILLTAHTYPDKTSQYTLLAKPVRIDVLMKTLE